MTELTNAEIAEVATALLAQVGRDDLRIVYAGNGWFHRASRSGSIHLAIRERRRDVVQTIANLHTRIAREAAERPEKERRAREQTAALTLRNAAPTMLAALRDVAKHIDDDMNSRPVMLWKLRETVTAAIAEATKEQTS